MRIDGLFGDGEAQAESALAFVETHERRKRLLDLSGWETATAVFDFDDDASVLDLPA